MRRWGRVVVEVVSCERVGEVDAVYNLRHKEKVVLFALKKYPGSLNVDPRKR